MLVAEFKEGGGRDYIQVPNATSQPASNLMKTILLQVGVLMHESDFNYNQTQQVARERQRVELSSEGLYDIQVLSVTLNTTELTMPLSFIVEWGGRQSDTFTFQELQEDTSKNCYSINTVEHGHSEQEGELAIVMYSCENGKVG